MAVNNDQEAKAGAETKKYEALLVLGVVGIVDEQCTLIGEDGLGVLEGHLVLAKIRRSLGWVPFELER